MLTLSLWHGATFLTIRTDRAGDASSVGLKQRLAYPAALLMLGFAVWTYLVARRASVA